MLAYLRTYRPLNIAFIVLAQFFAAYYLNFSAQLQSLLDGKVLWLLLGTASAAAFGYWINDFFDIRRDAINKPGINQINKFPPIVIYIHFLLFIVLCLYSGYRLGTWFLFVNGAVLLSLFLYSFHLKDLPLIGNLVIAFLSSLVIFMVYRLFPETDIMLVVHFTLLSGFVTLIRELIKDGEDRTGDSSVKARTLAVVLSTKVYNFIIYLFILFTLSFLVILLYYERSYLHQPLIWVYYGYHFLFVIIPLYKAAIDVRFARQREDYTLLSSWLKYCFFTGILSILFF
jgi:4-hydroxybenzoate polyprenyltransferase